MLQLKQESLSTVAEQEQQLSLKHPCHRLVISLRSDNMMYMTIL